MFNTFFTYITYTYKLCNMCARKCFIDNLKLQWFDVGVSEYLNLECFTSF